MNNNRNAEVLIDGKIYSFSGEEDQQYLQRIASYISDKTAQLKAQDGFTKQSQEYQAVMVEFNIADDYFMALDRAAVSDKKRDDMGRESYSLKHELVTIQMALDRKEKELDEIRQELAEVKKEFAEARKLIARSEELTKAAIELATREALEAKEKAEAELEDLKLQTSDGNVQLQSLKEQHDAEMQDLKDQHAAELQDLRDQHTTKLEDLKYQYAQEINSLREERQADKSELMKLRALQAAYSQGSGNQGNQHRNQNYNQNYNQNRNQGYNRR